MFHQLQLRRISSEIAWIVFSQISILLVGFLSVTVFTRLLDASIYGEIALGLTVSTLINLVAFGPLGSAFLRYYSVYSECGVSSLYLSAVHRLLLYYCSRLTIGILVIYLLLDIFNFSYLAEAFVVAATHGLFFELSGALEMILLARRLQGLIALQRSFGVLLRFILGVLFVVLFDSCFVAVFAGYLLGSLILLPVQIYFLLQVFSTEPTADKFEPKSDDKRLAQDMFNYAQSFRTFGIFSWLHQSSERWILQAFLTSREVGIFMVLYQIGYLPLAALAGVFEQLISPILFQTAGGAKDSSKLLSTLPVARKLSLGIISCSILYTVCFLLFNEQISSLLGESFRDFTMYSVILSLAAGVFFAGQILLLPVLCSLKSHIVLKVKIISAVMGVITTTILTGFFGLIGLLVASLLFSLFYYCICWHFPCKTYDFGS